MGISLTLNIAYISVKFYQLYQDSKKQYVAWGYPIGTPPPYDPFRRKKQ